MQANESCKVLTATMKQCTIQILVPSKCTAQEGTEKEQEGTESERNGMKLEIS